MENEFLNPQHLSDCEIFNEPALPNKPCTCGIDKIAIEALSVLLYMFNGDASLNFNEGDPVSKTTDETLKRLLKLVSDYRKWDKKEVVE